MVRTSIVAAVAAALLLGFGVVSSQAFVVVAPAGRARTTSMPMRMAESTSDTTAAPASSCSTSTIWHARVVDLGSRRDALLGGAMALSSAVLLGSQLQPAVAAAGGSAASSYYPQVQWVCGREG